MCATVVKVEKKEKMENPPLLYDLTTLQKEANTKHGFTAEQTLDLAFSAAVTFDADFNTKFVFPENRNVRKSTNKRGERK